MEIVVLEHFSFAYPADGPTRCALTDVNLRVEQGALCVVSGDTGSGKSTLLRACKPELMPAGTAQGTVRVCGVTTVDQGKRTDTMSVRDSAERIGFVMQDPGAQIVCDTVWHELAFGLENLGTPQEQMRRRVAEVAHFFGIEPWMNARTETLSGGQKQLLNLASALVLHPDLLLLDEPTAQLDPNARRQFIGMLARVNQELGVTVVVATHAPEELEIHATQGFELSEPVPQAERAQVEALLAARRQCRRDALATAPVCIQADEVHFRYERTAPWVLRGLSVQVKQGSVHAFVGGNGCGKTTLMRLAAGLDKPQRGKVACTLRGSQAFMPQDPKALFVCDTVREELLEWQGRAGYGAAEADAMATRFGLSGCLGQHPYDVSGGQQQKLALAKLLLCKPDLLFLDEPTKGLDPRAAADVIGQLARLADDGVTVVLVTHDLDVALCVADQISMVFDGELACTEPAEQFFQHNLVYRPSARCRLFGALLHRDKRDGGICLISSLLGDEDEPRACAAQPGEPSEHADAASGSASGQESGQAPSRSQTQAEG